MTEEPGQAGLDAPGSWAEDWRTIWQSELAALAVDREAQEAVQRMASHLLAIGAGLHAAPPPRPPDGAARPDAPARPASAAAPPGDGDGAGLAGLVRQLEQRIAELERQLARS